MTDRPEMPGNGGSYAEVGGWLGESVELTPGDNDKLIVLGRTQSTVLCGLSGHVIVAPI